MRRSDIIARGLLWLLMLACCVAPLAWLVGSILVHPEALTAALWSNWTWLLFVKTLGLAAASGLLSTALALFPAIALVQRLDQRVWRTLVITLLLMPVLTPSIVMAYGWGEVLSFLEMVPYPQGWADHLRCVWVLATWLWPIPCGVLALALSRVERDLIDQSKLDGAMMRLLARRCAPAAAGASLLATLLAMQEFSVFEPSGISVLSTEVRMIFETGRTSATDNPITQLQGGVSSQVGLGTQVERSAMAMGAGLPAVVAVVALLSVGLRLIARDAGDLAADSTPVAGNWRFPGVTAGAVCVILLVLVVPIWGLLQALGRPFRPLDVINELAPQLSVSLGIAVGSGCLATVIGVLAMIAPSRVALIAALAGFLVGGQFLAIALLRLYGMDLAVLGRLSPVSLVLDSNLAVVLAHVARFGWIALLVGIGTHRGGYAALRRMAAVDGAGPLGTAAWVVLPRAWPALAASGVLVATLSLTEVPAAALLTPPSLVPLLMTWVHLQRYGPMIEASLLLVLVVGLASLLLQALASIAMRRSALRAAILLLLGPLGWTGGCGDPLDQPVDIWLSTGDGPGRVVYPRAIASNPLDDTFFIVDRQARIQRLDGEGSVLQTWPMPEWAQGKPVGLSVGPDGNLWVPDTHYHRVIIYSPQGRELARFGKRGTSPGEFDLITDLAFDAAGNIYIGEYGLSNRVQVFDKDFNFIRVIGRTGSGDGEFERPQSVAVVGDELYVADSCNHRIQVFTLEGRFLRHLGRPGGAAGEFRFPYGLEVDPDQHLLVTEFGNMRVQRIDRQSGTSLGQWGGAGKLPGELMSPWAAVADNTGRVLIADSGNNRIQVIRADQIRPAP